MLCGYSLGGRLALRAALRDPGRYRGLVTIGASAGIEEPVARSARAEADERLAGWMETMPIAEIVSVWERQPLFADQGDALVEAQRAGPAEPRPACARPAAPTAGQGTLDPVWLELETLRPPLLALAGARDEPYARAAERMAAAVPEGRFALVEHAGHAAHLQRPEDVARLLADLARWQLDLLHEHLGQRVLVHVHAQARPARHRQRPCPAGAAARPRCGRRTARAWRARRRA